MYHLIDESRSLMACNIIMIPYFKYDLWYHSCPEQKWCRVNYTQVLEVRVLLTMIIAIHSKSTIDVNGIYCYRSCGLTFIAHALTGTLSSKSSNLACDIFHFVPHHFPF